MDETWIRPPVVFKLEVPFEFPYTDRMKNKKPYKDETLNALVKALAEETVYRTESEENEELAENTDICVCNSTGEFVDWLLDTIRNDMHKCARLKDQKGLSALNFLLNKIEDKLAEE